MKNEKKSGNKVFYIVDGNSFAYRAFYGIRPLTGPGGIEVHAVYGFFNMIKRVIKERKPDYFAVAFDSSGPTKRHEKFMAYKEQREKMPESLQQQLKIIKEILDKANISRIEENGLEADDIIASVCFAAKSEGIKSVIVSGDKDLIQLIDKNVLMLKISPSGEEMLGHEEIVKKYGINPAQMTDILALMGDASDNIPGVEGVGEKTAYRLIGEFGNTENLIKNIDEIKPEKLKNKIKNDLDNLKLSRELVALKPDRQWIVDSGFNPEKCDVKKINFLALNHEFIKLNFKSLVDNEMVKKDYEENDFLKKEKIFSKTNKNAEDIQSVFFCGEGNELIFSSFGKKFYFKKFEDAFLIDPKKILITNSGKEIYKILPDYKGEIWDVSLMSYLLQPDRNYPDFSNIFSEYLGNGFVSYDELAGKGAKKIMVELLSDKQKEEYANPYLANSGQLKDILLQKLKEEEMLRLYKEIELPTSKVLAEMEKTGLRIDAAYLGELDNEIGMEVRKCEEKIHKIAGENFNINSPKQLGFILFEKLKLPAMKKNKTGYSTDAEVLSNLEEKHIIINEILNYRALVKLKTGFIDAISGYMDKNSMIYPVYNQDVASTGRLSSSKPNIQNIPVRGEESRGIRKIFVPLKGHDLILKADYSQIELRILAHFSNDEKLIEAFRKGDDIHSITGCGIFGVEPEKLTSEMRRFAKTINFGIIYGISPFGLAKQLKVSNKKASEYIDSFFMNFPNVAKYQKTLVESVKRDGYVSTIFGRRRKFPEINSQNRVIREFAERGAINAPIQGSAADIIKVAMIKINERMNLKKMESKMLLQVHDELVFSVKNGELDEVKKIAVDFMENAVRLKVPLIVNTGTGKNWHEAG